MPLQLIQAQSCLPGLPCTPLLWIQCWQIFKTPWTTERAKSGTDAKWLTFNEHDELSCGQDTFDLNIYSAEADACTYATLPHVDINPSPQVLTLTIWNCCYKNTQIESLLILCWKACAVVLLLGCYKHQLGLLNVKITFQLAVILLLLKPA